MVIWSAPHAIERADLARITEASELGPVDSDREHWDVLIQFYVPSRWDFSPCRGSPDEPVPAMAGLVIF